MLTRLNLRLIIGLLFVFWTGCDDGCTSEPSSKVHEQQLINLRTEWKTNPLQEQTLNKISKICKEALEQTDRQPSLDLILADTLSNILLRPDLGLPLYQPYVETLDPVQQDQYRNTLLRALELEALSQSLRSEQHNIAYRHPVSLLIAHHSKTQREINWQTWLHELNGVLLFEAAPMVGRQSVDRPAPKGTDLFETLRILLPNWTIRVSIVEVRRQSDNDPWKTHKKTPISGGKKQLLAYGDFGRSQSPSPEFWFSKATDRPITVVFEWQHPSGRPFIACFDAVNSSEGVIIKTSCSNRFNHLLDAVELYAQGLKPNPDSFVPLLIPDSAL